MGGCASRCCCLCCLGEWYKYAFYDGDKKGRVPSCWPCAATGLYMRMPSARNKKKDALRADADVLYRAMKGCGTYDSDLARVVANRTPEQLAEIKSIFDKEKGEEDSLEQWIKDDTSGDWRRILTTCVRDPAERDAELIHDAISGLGTADDELIEIITTRTNKQILAIAEAYKRMYNTSMGKDIKEDTSLNYRQTLLATANRADYLAERLRKAIAIPGTDDSRVVRILTSTPRDLSVLRQIASEYEDVLNLGLNLELEYELSMPDLQDVRAAYLRRYGTPLEVDIAKDTSGNYRAMCLALLQPLAEQTADSFNECMAGAGTNDNMLIELCVARSNRTIQDADKAFRMRYGRSIALAIDAETSGDYKRTLQSLVLPRAEVYANSLYDAYDGPGTDDERTIAVLTGRPRREIQRICEAFLRKYGTSLEDATRSETSFWYRRLLTYIIRQSSEDLIWLPEDQIVRMRDV